jgi:hypothetical protein
MRFKLQLFLLLFMLTGAANAGIVTWYLHDVDVAANGGVYEGYVWGDFTFDSATSSILQYHVSLEAVPGQEQFFPGVTDAQPITNAGVSDLSSIVLGEYRSIPGNTGVYGFLDLFLADPLSDSATHIDIIPGSPSTGSGSEEGESFYFTGHAHRYVTSGFISTTGPGSAPEPATFCPVLAGLWLFGKIVANRAKRGTI